MFFMLGKANTVVMAGCWVVSLPLAIKNAHQTLSLASKSLFFFCSLLLKPRQKASPTPYVAKETKFYRLNGRMSPLLRVLSCPHSTPTMAKCQAVAGERKRR